MKSKGQRKLPSKFVRCPDYPYCQKFHDKTKDEYRKHLRRAQNRAATSRQARTTPSTSRRPRSGSRASETWATRPTSVVRSQSFDSGPPRLSAPPSPTRAEKKADRRAAAGAANKQIISQKVDVPGYALDLVFNPDGVYSRVAAHLTDGVPLHRRSFKGHWLCKQIDDAADVVGTAMWAKEIEKVSVDLLIRSKCPRFMARILGSGARLGFKMATKSLPFDHIALGIRAVIPLVCPDISRCPAERKVIHAFGDPIAAKAIKETFQST